MGAVTASPAPVTAGAAGAAGAAAGAAATGAGAGSRVALGAAVVFGMLVNTVVATLYIPNWYEVMQTLEEKKK